MVCARRVSLVETGGAIKIKAHDQGRDAERPASVALRVALGEGALRVSVLTRQMAPLGPRPLQTMALSVRGTVKHLAHCTGYVLVTWATSSADTSQHQSSSAFSFKMTSISPESDGGLEPPPNSSVTAIQNGKTEPITSLQTQAFGLPRATREQCHQHGQAMGKCTRPRPGQGPE